MSHFTVLVIGDNPDQQLAPFQENNMGDCPEEYLKFHDEETEALEKYATGSREMAKIIEGAAVLQGESESTMPTRVILKPLYDDHFKMEITEEEYETTKDQKGVGYSHKDGKRFFYRTDYSGAEIVDVPFRELYSTFEEYMKEYEGREKRDPKTGKYGYWENDNAKWDWYTLGGRWTGFFKLKPIDDSFMGFSDGEMKNFAGMLKSDPEKFDKIASKYNGKSDALRTKVKEIADRAEGVQYPEHQTGRPGLMTDKAEAGYADSTKKKYIDVEGMRKDAVDRAAELYDKVMNIIGHLPINETWEVVRERYADDMDKAREEYHKQPRCQEFRKHQNDFGFFSSADEYLIDRDTYLKNASDRAIATFAVIKDGKWYEKGKMGWWGITTDEKEQADWNQEFSKLLDSVDEETVLSVYDCHI